jgi:hypothetical protein
MTEKKFNIQEEKILQIYLNEITKIKKLTPSETNNLIDKLEKIKRVLKEYSKKYKVPMELAL